MHTLWLNDSLLVGCNENFCHLSDKGDRRREKISLAKGEKVMNEFQVTNTEFVSFFAEELASNSKGSAPQSKSDLFISRDLKSNASIQTSLSAKQH